jgi:sporulation protein YlmC with PRC-barrel domain
MKKKIGALIIGFTFLVGSHAFAAGAQTGAYGTSESPGTAQTSPGAVDQRSPGAVDQRSPHMTDQRSPHMTQESPAVGMDIHHRASEWIGHQVRTPQGEDLGSIDDVVFDNDGQIQYLILSRGGLLGIGATLIPVPFDSAEFTFDKDNLIAHNLNAQMLEGAPVLADNEWGRLSDPTFERDVRGYYEQGAMRDPSPRAFDGSPRGVAPSPGMDRPGVTSPDTTSPGTTSPEGTQTR